MRVLSGDVAGRVEAVGAGVTGFVVGDEVLGDLSRAGWRAFAEYARTDEDGDEKVDEDERGEALECDERP